jgi:hypothetical protein
VVSGGGHLEYLVSNTYFPAYFPFQFFILKYVAEKLSYVLGTNKKQGVSLLFIFIFMIVL